MTRRALMLREGKAPVWERLLTMLFLAGLLHGLVILGLTFNAAASAGPISPASQRSRSFSGRATPRAPAARLPR